MSRSSILILLGILIILTPFSGLPITIRTLLTIIFGACVLGVGLSLRSREIRGPLPPIESLPPLDVTPML